MFGALTMTLVAGMHARLPLRPCPDPAAGLLLGLGQGLGHKAAWAGVQRSWARLPSSLAHLAFMHTWLTKLRELQEHTHNPQHPSSRTVSQPTRAFAAHPLSSSRPV